MWLFFRDTRCSSPRHVCYRCVFCHCFFVVVICRGGARCASLQYLSLFFCGYYSSWRRTPCVFTIFFVVFSSLLFVVETHTVRLYNLSFFCRCCLLWRRSPCVSTIVVFFLLCNNLFCVKFIFFPICRVVCNIIKNEFIFGIITNNMVMKTFLPYGLFCGFPQFINTTCCRRFKTCNK